jgi:hypothetical protein
VALVAGILVTVVGIHARTSDTSGLTASAKTNGMWSRPRGHEFWKWVILGHGFGR